VRIAFTMDDLPVYPHLALPDGYTPALVADSVLKAFDRHLTYFTGCKNFLLVARGVWSAQAADALNF
jgi:hypothetical protein